MKQLINILKVIFIVVVIGLSLYLYSSDTSEQTKLEAQESQSDEHILQELLMKYNELQEVTAKIQSDSQELFKKYQELQDKVVKFMSSPYDPFNPKFNPIVVSNFINSQEALKKAISILTENGFEVEVNSVFNTVTSLPKKIGYQLWESTKEKWEISYQVGIQIINFQKKQNYWKLSHKIVGTRSGKEDRLFEPSDFKITDQMFTNLNKKLMNSFCRME